MEIYIIFFFFFFARTMDIRGGVLAYVCVYGVFYYGPFCKNKILK